MIPAARAFNCSRVALPRFPFCASLFLAVMVLPSLQRLNDLWPRGRAVLTTQPAPASLSRLLARGDALQRAQAAAENPPLVAVEPLRLEPRAPRGRAPARARGKSRGACRSRASR